MQIAGMRQACRVLLLVVPVVVLGACGDDDGGASTTTLGVSTTATAPGATTTSGPVVTTTTPATTLPPTSAPVSVPVPAGVDPAMVPQLQAAIDAYDQAYALATAAPGDPSHVDFLAATTDGDLRRGVQAAIADRRDAGEALRPGPSGVVVDQRIEAIEAATADEATVLTCLFNGSERYVVSTGELLDGTQVAWENRVVLRRGDDGAWRVDRGERVGESREVEANPCA